VSDERPWWASPGDPRHGEVCQICPLCALLRVVDDAHPEVVEHIAEAARHLSLAAKAIIDAYAAGFPDRDEPLERIDVEDD
jgi:hypothetical protein